jgi:hypothetical protein
VTRVGQSDEIAQVAEVHGVRALAGSIASSYRPV